MLNIRIVRLHVLFQALNADKKIEMSNVVASCVFLILSYYIIYTISRMYNQLLNKPLGGIVAAMRALNRTHRTFIRVILRRKQR